MKKIFILSLSMLSFSAFASNITHCEFEDIRLGGKMTIAEANVYTALKIDTSWVYRADCPRLIGVKYLTKDGSGVEYHSLYRSEMNDADKTQTCFYNFEAKEGQKYKAVSCSMLMN